MTDHPLGRAAGEADEAKAIALIAAIADAGSRLRLSGTSPDGPDGPEPTDADYSNAADAVVTAWRRASPGGRRDALAICAEMAARTSPVIPTASPPANTEATKTVQTWVQEFVALAGQDLADGTEHLTAPAPWLPATTLTATHAQSLVANTAITDTTKVVIATVLSSLANPAAQEALAALG